MTKVRVGVGRGGEEQLPTPPPLLFTILFLQHCDENFIYYGVLQRIAPRPLLFVLFINEFHTAIEFSSVYHFVADTNPLHSKQSLKFNKPTYQQRSKKLQLTGSGKTERNKESSNSDMQIKK